jgi:hypothetical protein
VVVVRIGGDGGGGHGERCVLWSDEPAEVAEVLPALVQSLGRLLLATLVV